MIEDSELREVFKIESEEHLRRLESGLLRLEKGPGDSGLIEEVFREAHSLKGSARMLGLSDIAMLAHRLEDSLGALRKGSTRISSEMIDGMLHSLSTIGRLVSRAVSEEGPAVQPSDAPSMPAAKGAPAAPLPAPVAFTKGMEPSVVMEIRSEPPGTPRVPVESIETEGDGRLPDSSSDVTVSPELPIEEFRIETIRVETRKLDTLMTQIGELSVTTNRAGYHLGLLEEILGTWEDVRARERMTEELLLNLDHAGHGGIPSRLFDCRRLRVEATDRLGSLLTRLRNAVNEDRSKLTFVTGELEDGVRSIRLMPLAVIFNLFPRMVRDLAREQSKEVLLEIEGGETTADKRIVEEMKAPLMHMIRNAVDHGIEAPDVRARNGKPRTGRIVLKASRTPTNIVIALKDDGRGLQIDAIKRMALKRKICRQEELSAMTPGEIHNLIFTPGFSTSPFVSDVSGRGVGLDVVRTNVERLKGSIRIESSSGIGSSFELRLPITLTTTRVLILETCRVYYAVPVEHVETTRLVPRQEIFVLEGRETMLLYGRPISVARLSDLLDLPAVKGEVELPLIACIVIHVGEDKLGLFVDAVLDEQEIVLKPQSRILKRVRNISGATILGTGKVCMVLNPADLIKSVRKKELSVSMSQQPAEEERRRVILMAEDSLTTRAQMKRIIESAGYEVVTAVDGLDAYNKLGSGAFDALVSDIQMPNMDGLTLTAKVRQDRKYREIPIILVTSLSSDEDKKAGIEAGANAYISKPTFDQRVLLETLDRLV